MILGLVNIVIGLMVLCKWLMLVLIVVLKMRMGKKKFRISFGFSLIDRFWGMVKLVKIKLII